MTFSLAYIYVRTYSYYRRTTLLSRYSSNCPSLASKRTTSLMSRRLPV